MVKGFYLVKEMLLPLPPMLMFDRIQKITKAGGKFNKGYLKAELDIKEDLWFFKCHFQMILLCQDVWV